MRERGHHMSIEGFIFAVLCIGAFVLAWLLLDIFWSALVQLYDYGRYIRTLKGGQHG